MAAHPKELTRGMMRGLPRSVVAAIDNSHVLGVRAGSRSTHRFTGIWPIVIDGRVFGRSWSLKPDGWYHAFREDPRGAVRIGTRTIRVRAVPPGVVSGRSGPRSSGWAIVCGHSNQSAFG